MLKTSIEGSSWNPSPWKYVQQQKQEQFVRDACVYNNVKQGYCGILMCLCELVYTLAQTVNIPLLIIQLHFKPGQLSHVFYTCAMHCGARGQ